MAEEFDPNSTDITTFLSDIGVRLRDIEEKQNLIKDRVLLISDNLVFEKEETSKELTNLKAKIFQLEEEIKKLKLTLERVIDDSGNFVRKNEFQILQRQFEMFQPLKLATIEDVKNLIKEALKKQK